MRTIPFARATDQETSVITGVDLGAVCVPLFQRFRDALEVAERQWQKQANRDTRSRWGVPPLFFFEERLQEEWTSSQKRASIAHNPHFAELHDLVDDILPLLQAEVAVRHAARAIPGLKNLVAKLSRHSAPLEQVARHLQVVDDESLIVLVPQSGLELRLRLRGAESVGSLLILLAETARREGISGLPPTSRPTREWIEAASGQRPDGRLIASTHWRLLRPMSLRDGILPLDLDATDEWLWPQDHVNTIDRVDGERVVVLTRGSFPTTWEMPLAIVPVECELEKLTPGAIPLRAAEIMAA